ncbi:MAG: protein-disulfide reductase DsbD family protein, partial [Alphaproteobacteria bacterium]
MSVSSAYFNNTVNYNFHNVVFPDAKIGNEEIGTEKIQYSYYTDHVIIPIIVELKDQNSAFHADMILNFAVCKDVCVPVSQNFSLDLSENIDKSSLLKIEKYFGSKLTESNENFEDVDMSLNVEKENNLTSFFVKIILAVIGGVILNIMPCVLPVLSIKLMSLIKHSGASKEKIKKGFFATIFGIEFCFIILALITYSIKSVGSNLGWGFQFQNPYFIIFLIIVLTLFTAELIGFFDLTYSQFLATILNKKITQKTSEKNIFVPNFLSGVLAVLLATPCSAPFLGSAISFALTQNFITILTIFFFIGVGFSLPYILLILFPNAIKYLPKPGSWMQKTKQILAGFLFATAVWLTYVLCNIIGYFPGIVTGILALILFFSFKIKQKLIKNILLLFVIFLSFILPIEFHEWESQKKQELNSLWKTFDETLLSNQIAQGKVVLVDVTADWCLTCKFNKILVLNSPEINSLLKSGEIIGFRADITKPD